jgi:hypothetical protein
VVSGLTPRTEGPQRSSLAALIAVESAILGARRRASEDLDTPRHGTARRSARARDGRRRAVRGLRRRLKYLTHAHGPPLGLLSPWTLTDLISFYASARILQIGLALEVIAITSVAANVAAIRGGILVFGEPIGPGALGITAGPLAICLVIASAALVPAPLRARSDPEQPRDTVRGRRWGDPIERWPIAA